MNLVFQKKLYLKTKQKLLSETKIYICLKRNVESLNFHLKTHCNSSPPLYLKFAIKITLLIYHSSKYSKIITQFQERN